MVSHEQSVPSKMVTSSISYINSSLHVDPSLSGKTNGLNSTFDGKLENRKLINSSL